MTEKGTSPFVHFGPAPAGIELHVAEAVQALGYFRPDAVDGLVEVFRQLWPKGCSGKMLIYNDLERMTEEETRSAGIGTMRMPRAVWALMTPKGQASPMHAARATAIRIQMSVNRARSDREERKWSTFCSRVKLAGITDYCCAMARSVNGEVRPREGRPKFPLKGCDAEWCSCRWDYVPDE